MIRRREATLPSIFSAGSSSSCRLYYTLLLQEDMGGCVGTLLLGALAVFFPWVVWKVVVEALLWRPYLLTKRFREQGVGGPPYTFFSGSLREIRAMERAARGVVLDVNSHDLTHKVQPHYHRWSSQYGRTFLYWFGAQPRICITHLDMVKEVISKFSFYTKANPRPSILALLGKGLVLSEGVDWVRHRKVVSPAFTMDKLKIMTKKMAECTISMLDEWQDQVTHDKAQSKAIDMSMQIQELTANVISHTAFGSSYAEGKEVFLAQKELQLWAVATAFNIFIPGSQYLPTSQNLCKLKLERTVREKLTQIIQNRLDGKDSNYGNDLLGLMMEACRMDSGRKQEKLKLTMDEIIDECKTFFFAGHETTSHLLTWTMFLLSSNIQWQEKLREEVLRECGGEVPHADTLSKLKLVNMVLLETLRLYSPIIVMVRRAAQDMKLGNLTVPKDTVITIPLLMMQRDKDHWGADADQFNPLRFENGVSRAANHPNALLSFSMGPRSCVGQNFAMLEAKLVIAMILQRFTFLLSPEYKHAPASLITLQPQFGLPVVLRPLHE